MHLLSEDVTVREATSAFKQPLHKADDSFSSGCADRCKETVFSDIKASDLLINALHVCICFAQLTENRLSIMKNRWIDYFILSESAPWGHLLTELLFPLLSAIKKIDMALWEDVFYFLRSD